MCMGMCVPDACVHGSHCMLSDSLHTRFASQLVTLTSSPMKENRLFRHLLAYPSPKRVHPRPRSHTLDPGHRPLHPVPSATAETCSSPGPSVGNRSLTHAPRRLPGTLCATHTHKHTRTQLAGLLAELAAARGATAAALVERDVAVAGWQQEASARIGAEQSERRMLKSCAVQVTRGAEQGRSIRLSCAPGCYIHRGDTRCGNQ